MAEQSLTGQYNKYIESLFTTPDPVLQQTLAHMQQQDLPSINVSANEGKLLHMLALMTGTKRILEIGTLGGYSATWLARALPDDGEMISLELDAHHAEVAQTNLQRAGLHNKVKIMVGPAAESLKILADTNPPAFDLIFVDADKDGYTEYLKLALPLLREGGLILGDNTLPHAVLEEGQESGTKSYNSAVAAEPSLISTILPILRGQGLDGLTVSIKRTA